MELAIITLWQPWASLVVRGYKKIETRSFNIHFRGTLLIHAAKYQQAAIQQSNLPYFKECIGGIDATMKLPYGKLIGAATLSGTLATECISDYVNNGNTPTNNLKGVAINDWVQEFSFGNYSPGRFGWLFKNAVEFKEPIPWKGAQGLRYLRDLENKPEQILNQLPLQMKI